jgi:hypothetical protein
MRRLVEGYAPLGMTILRSAFGLCPSTMLRMVPLPRWGRIW